MTALITTMRNQLPRIDRVWAFLLMAFLILAVLRTADVAGIAGATIGSLLHTAPYILFAVLALAYLRASGAEGLVAKVFEGSQTRAIILAAMVGALAPFCSCEVIPFIAAMLALGAPLPAIMAFWLSSPIMDPAMFALTAGTLGLPFAIAKTASALGMGLLGGFGLRALMPLGLFDNPLKSQPKTCGSCCSASPENPLEQKPVWKFWAEAPRLSTFRDTALENALFLLKWLALAYFVEALMVRYVPMEWVGTYLGGEGFIPVISGALIGGPAYLNGYAAVALLDGLTEQGLGQGPAMAFVLAGSVSCIPAALAVWALVRPKVFAAYLGLAFVGSVSAALIWGMVSAI